MRSHTFLAKVPRSIAGRVPGGSRRDAREADERAAERDEVVELLLRHRPRRIGPREVEHCAAHASEAN